MNKKTRPNDPCHCGSGIKYKKCHMEQDKQARNVARQSAALNIKPVEKGIVSPPRVVPPHIPRPYYAETGEVRHRSTTPLVPSAEVADRIRVACKAAARVLEKTCAAAKPGMTTDELDAIAHQAYIDEGGYPSPLNYGHFPKSVCTSVNEVICHGIPDSRKLEDGDILNIDVTIFLNGVHGDCNRTIFIGNVDEASKKLVQVTEECLMLGIKAVKPGAKVRDIGRAIENHAKAHGYSVVRSFCGHGIGEDFHNSLYIPHYYDPRERTEIKKGMVFTIEPMINIGSWEDRIWSDNWTAVTADGSRSAQFEHTIIVTDDGAEILTRV